jgi:hypothetical protein
MVAIMAVHAFCTPVLRRSRDQPRRGAKLVQYSLANLIFLDDADLTRRSSLPGFGRLVIVDGEIVYTSIDTGQVYNIAAIDIMAEKPQVSTLFLSGKLREISVEAEGETVPNVTHTRFSLRFQEMEDFHEACYHLSTWRPS